MNRKILVVEDNALNMKLMRGIFEIGQFDIIEAVDAEIGIRLAKDEKPFLILMDIQLPGMNGLEATRDNKAGPDTKDIPVVALTGLAMEGDYQRAIEAGCDDFITKPIGIDNILSLIKSYCSGNGKNEAATFG
jgi:CheY-like chemotaxis protein